MKLKSFSEYMDLISYRYRAGQVFSDFLKMTICALSMSAAEDRYFEIIKRFDKPELEQFSLAFAALVNEMTGDGSGLIDVLGELFMINTSEELCVGVLFLRSICTTKRRINIRLLKPKPNK